MSRQPAISAYAILALATLALAACGSVSQRKVEVRDKPAPVEARTVGAPAASTGGYLAGDGPGADVPPDLDGIPDAVPRDEPLHRYANRPYVALGKTYTPLTIAGNFRERGIASWYGKKFHGQRTSSGEVYDMYGMTAAHPTLPIPSYVRVTNVANRKSVVVRINDRGPFLHERVIDLSYAAAYKLGIISEGRAEVEVESVAGNTVTAPVAAAEQVTSAPLPPAEIPPKTDMAEQDAAAEKSAAGSGNVYLQLGAFKSQEAAESFMAQMRAKLGDMGSRLSLFIKDGLTRVHLGPFASQDEARSNADSLRGKLGFKPLLNLH